MLIGWAIIGAFTLCSSVISAIKAKRGNPAPSWRIAPTDEPRLNLWKGTKEMETKETQKLTFTCSCNGCRNYPTRPAEIWHESQIASKAQGYFFTPETMRYFSSRIADFKPVGISPRADSLAVIVSSKFGYEYPRHYEIVVLCPYGEIWRDDQTAGELVKYETLKKARASKTWNFQMPAPVCSCHGCQLDRAGR